MGQLQTFLKGTADHWLSPLFVLAIASGCRLSELLGLLWKDIDLRTATITIKRNLPRIGGQWIGGTPKTRAGERTVTLPAEGVRALQRQRTQWAGWRLRAGRNWEDWDLVFTRGCGAPLYGTTVAHALRRECDRLGVARMTPHQLRHLHASLLLGKGLPVPAVSRRLGHGNAAITLAVYGHHLPGQDEEAAQAIGKAISTGRERLSSL